MPWDVSYQDDGSWVVRTGRPADWDELSEREQQIARLAAQGMTVAEIARSIFLNPRTVELNIVRLCDRTSSRNRAELSIWVAKHIE